ncbi:protein PF14_0175-like [Frieseomelitta varia]|uniref:protein PF14_0175-like n=1 Tax=Frieseomelitta varia TaxID=561572 RepID=UPI001CB6885C|nr:protein PF14_0175-like [Frieseomelitta varia]
MLESTQTGSVEAVNFDNLVLKQWLRYIGPIHRCEVLKKLKADLQNLGLSQRQVHRGLIQLATKPCVVLMRQISYRKHRLKGLLEDEEERKILHNSRTNASNLRLGSENVHKINTTERYGKRGNEYIRETDGIVAYKEDASISNNRNKRCKLDDRVATMHSFDEALEQLDKIVPSKMNIHEKLSNRSSSVPMNGIVKSQYNNIVLNKTYDKDENHIENKDKHRRTQKTSNTQKISDLIFDKVRPNKVQINENKRNHTKLNQYSCSNKINDYITSNVYKKIDTKYRKLDVDKKLHNTKSVDINVNSIPNKNKYFKYENSISNCTLSTGKVVKIKEKMQEKKLYKSITSDFIRKKNTYAHTNENKEIIRKKIIKKFRTYFGDCLSVSEDEEEQNILRKRFKIRKKKDSVNSCDSGVYVTEKSTTMTDTKVLDDIQETITPDSITQKFNENTSQETIHIIHELNEVITNTNIETNQVKNAINSKEIENNKLQNSTDENKIYSIETRKDELSQDMLINISEKDNLQPGKDIVNVKDILQVTEQSEDKISENKLSQDMLSNISEKDNLEQGKGIVNVKDILQVTEQSEDKVSENELSQDMLINISEDNLEQDKDIVNVTDTFQITEKSKDKVSKNELSQDMFINISEKDNLEQSKNVINVADISQVTEQSEDRVSIAEMKTKIKINNVSSDISEICILNHNAISENFSEFETCDLNIKDFNELLHMNFEENCQITSNGNVLSIQETVEKIIDKNVSTNNTYNVLNNESKLAMEKPKLNISDRKDTQFNEVFRGKLRVLSSAELGSRWCPTPVNSVPSTVPQSLVSQTVSNTTSLITASAFTTVSENMKKSNTDLKFLESVYVSCVKISNLIKNIRLSSVTNLNYNTLLFIEFENLRKILNTENYVDLIEGVVAVLNKEMSITPLLSVEELFRYTSLVESYYAFSLNKHKINVNEYQTITPTSTVVVSTEIVPNQDKHCNAQNIWASSVQSRLQYLLSTQKNQLCTNITTKPTHQNINEKIVSSSQNNVSQSNVAVNPIIFTNNNNNNNNDKMEQYNYKMQTYRNYCQQKISNVHIDKQKPITNMHVRQNFPVQYSFNEINQLESGQISARVRNTPSVNQQYIQPTCFVPTNTFHNVNVQNYSIQNRDVTCVTMQNLTIPTMTQPIIQNTVYQQPVLQPVPNCNISQPVPSSCHIPQPVLSNCHIPQPVLSNCHIPQSIQQTIVTMNVPHSVLKNTQPQQQRAKERLSQNYMPEQSQNIYLHKFKQLKKKENLQVSLNSTMRFNALKYISDIQKHTLLKQLNFYFSCTTHLKQVYTSKQWQQIHSEKFLLFHLQTALKRAIQKNVLLSDNLKQYSDKSETNILANINTNVPKMIQIIAKENQKTWYQVEASKTNQEQNKTVNIKQNCPNDQENLNVKTQNQYEKEHKTNNNSQKLSYLEQKLNMLDKKKIQNNTLLKDILLQTDNSLIKLNAQNYQTSDSIDVCRKIETEKEQNISKDIYNSNIKEQNLLHKNELKKIIENIPQTVNEKLLLVSDMKLSNKDTLQQLNPHLITVEISSANDQVTVIDTVGGETKSKNEEPKECQEHQQEKLHINSTLSSLENTSCDISRPSSSKSPKNDIKYLNNDEQLQNTLVEKPIISHIEDVRSISMEAFLKMDGSNNGLSNTTEGNIEEEEMKVCLFCGKPSTVACSICLEAKYCSKLCFELHWKDHYKDCLLAKRNVCS